MTRLVAVVSVCVVPTEAHGQSFLKKLGRAVESAVTAPVHVGQQLVDVVAGRQGLDGAAGNIVQQHLAPFQHLSGAAVDASQAVSAVHSEVLNISVDLAEQVADEPGRIVMHVATAPSRQTMAFQNTAVHVAHEVVQGNNPLVAVSAPLAAAIRAAEGEYLRVAQPIPPQVRNLLAPHFSAEVLANTRYTVNSLEITLPSLINGTHDLFGNDHAVVVGRVIVFSVNPGGNWSWWAHEITHVEQYARWGIEDFSRRCMTDYAGIEREAAERSRVVFNGTGGSAVVTGTPTPGFVPAGAAAAPPVNPGLAPVAIARFWNDPTTYVVTQSTFVWGVAPTGQGTWVARILPSAHPSFAWIYQLPLTGYGITLDGRIWAVNAWGQFVVIGQLFNP